MRKIFHKIRERISIYLSHKPGLYALLVGIGIVLFWRGVWHSTDFIHQIFEVSKGNFTIDLGLAPWWDGPLSFVVGFVLLYFTGAFTSSFIGNELILAGLRRESRIEKKTETEIASEEQSVMEVKNELKIVANKLDDLEKKLREKENHHK